MPNLSILPLAFIIIVLHADLPTASAQYLSDKDPTYKEIENAQNGYKSGNLMLQQLGQEYFTKENAYSFLLKMTAASSSYDTGTTKTATFKKMYEDYIPGDYPTRYQDPLEYLIFTPLINKISKTSKLIYPDINYVPKYGTFYYNSIAAERKSFRDDYLILIHSRYVSFCHEMGKVALQFYKGYIKQVDYADIKIDSPLLRHLIHADAQIPINFLYTFLEFHYEHFPLNDSLLLDNEKWLQQDFIQKALQYWNNSSETFLLGHEYTHALLKHKNIQDAGSDSLTDAICLESWFNEAQADSVSQEILNKITDLESNDPYNTGWNKYLLYGGLFYLTTLKLFENGQSVLADGVEIPELKKSDFNTIIEIFKNKGNFNANLKKFKQLDPDIRKLDHPPTQIRIALIEVILKNHLTKNSFPAIQNSPQEDLSENLSKNMLYFLSTINEACRSAFLNAHASKTTLDNLYK